MLQNYLKITLRNLWRQKAYSAINIVGLAIGMACCILIMLYVRSEFGYDQIHKKGDRIYRVLREFRAPGGTAGVEAGTSGLLAPALARDYPEIEQTVRLRISVVYVKYKNTLYNEIIGQADPNFFDLFDFPLRDGSPQTVFKSPYSLVIAQKMARQIFGDEDPIGKVLSVLSADWAGEYTVTGVVDNTTEKTTVLFDCLTATLNPHPESLRIWNNWLPTEAWRPAQTYVLLKPEQAAESLESKIQDVLNRYMGDEVRANNRYFLQPLTRTYMYSRSDYGMTQSWYGDIQRVYVMAGIGLMVLLIACINFMNLATARSERRAREVGLRKVVGADRAQIIRQFLGESILTSVLALLLALLLARLFLPTFNAFVGGSAVVQGYELSWGQVILDGTALVSLLPGLGLLAVLVGLLAGSYPAFYLSAFQPVHVLKGGTRTGSGIGWLRKTLVVCQFVVSVLLLVCTLVVSQQLSFLQNMNLGFEKAQVVVLPIFDRDREIVESYDDRLSARHNTVKQAFLAHPGVLKATAFRWMMGRFGLPRVMHLEGDPNAERRILMNEVDEDFFDTYGIDIIAGRSFSPDIPTDVYQSILLNESAVKAFDWADPVGKQVTMYQRPFTVIGVVKDFHGRSLREKIEPMGFFGRRGLFINLGLRIQGDNLPETLAFLEKTWKTFVPDQPFQFTFMDDHLNGLYQQEQRTGNIFGFASALAIFVACLGVLGLVAYITEQRTKEVGIRKVLGASEISLLLLLSKDFLILALSASIIAWPLAYLAMNRWLQGFAYRTDWSIWPFLLSGILAIVIALATVSFQAFKTVRSNPVDALRYE